MDETRTTLLLRLRDGNDQTAWRTFDQIYRPLLVGYARTRGVDANDAEDLAQECVQAVLDRIGEYEHLGSFKSWLRAIAENKIRDRFRARKREVQAESGVLTGLADAQETPEQVWERQWWSAHLRHCSEQVRHEVAPSTYSAFVEYAIEGRPPGVVAEKLGLSVNQVYVAKHRVLDRLRGIMMELTGCEAMEGMA